MTQSNLKSNRSQVLPAHSPSSSWFALCLHHGCKKITFYDLPLTVLAAVGVIATVMKQVAHNKQSEQHKVFSVHTVQNPGGIKALNLIFSANNIYMNIL